jgi:hypothetical protein
VLLSLVVCALINPGNFGTVDTTRRLQVARWIRSGEPPVSPADPDFGITGKNGTRHAYTGIGQSLVLLPFDALVSAAVAPQLSRFGLDASRQAQVVELCVAFLMQSFLTACALLLAYELLLSFGFTAFASAAGALSLLFATSCLQYVQCAQENLLQLVLVLCALWAVRRYQCEQRASWAALAGAVCGFAILIKLSSFLETAVIALYALTACAHRKRFLAGFVPPLTCAFVLERWYQYIRFGDVFSTYTGIFAKQLRPVNAPPSYPFSYPFWKGFFGALFSPDKSILLFDPLLIVLLLVAILSWRHLDRSLKQILGWLFLLLILYVGGSAKFYAFGGDVAWGDRYVVMPVQLLCLFAVPLLLTQSRTLPASGRIALWTIVAASLLLQAASTALAPNLEVVQRRMGYDNGVVWNRAVNLVQVARDQEGAGRFAGIPMEWRTLYYFPFQLRFRFPTLAAWAIGGWLALLALLPFLVSAMLQTARARIDVPPSEGIP